MKLLMKRLIAVNMPLIAAQVGLDSLLHANHHFLLGIIVFFNVLCEGYFNVVWTLGHSQS